MYTELMQRLEGLGDRLDPDVLQVFKDLLGACAQPLRHRGPLTVEVDGGLRGVPLRPFDQASDSEAGIFAAIQVSNFSSHFMDNGNVEGGYAGHFVGVSNFVAPTWNPDNVAALGGNDLPHVAIIASGIRTPRLYIDDLFDLLGNPLLSADDTGKVKVNSGDSLDYLEDQIAGLVTSTYSSGTDIPVKCEVVSGKLQFFIDVSAIAGYSAGTEQLLGKDTNDAPTYHDGDGDCDEA